MVTPHSSISVTRLPPKALRRRSLPHARVSNGTGFQRLQPQLAEDSSCSSTARSFEELVRSVKMVLPVFRNRCSHPPSALQTIIMVTTVQFNLRYGNRKVVHHNPQAHTNITLEHRRYHLALRVCVFRRHDTYTSEPTILLDL